MADSDAMNRIFHPTRWVQLLAPTIFILIVAVAPFVYLLSGNMQSGFLAQVFGNSPESVLTRRAIWNSFDQGIWSAVFSFLLGFPLGIFLGRFSFRFKKLVTSLVLIPFFLPSIIVVFAFISGFGNESVFQNVFILNSLLSSGFTGIVAVNTFFNAPLVALFTMTATEQADLSQDDAAMTLGSGTWERFTRIWGRNSIVAGLGGAVLAFMYSFAGFAAPLIIGGPKYFTLDAWIYFMVKTLNDLPVAVVLAIFEAILLVIPVFIYVFLFSTRRTRLVNTLASPTSRRRTGSFFFSGAAYTVAWIAVELYLLSSIVIESLHTYGSGISGVGNYYLLFGQRAASAADITASASIVNTVFYGSLTSLITISLGLLWVTGKRRLKLRNSGLTEISQYIPLIISAIIMAFAIYIVFGAMTPASLTWLLIIGAQSVVAIPVVLRVIDSGFSTIPVEYGEAAEIMGGNPFFEVELPLARSTFASALMFAFAISIGEFSATNFLAFGSFTPLTVEMYLLMDVRMIGPAYAAATILLLVSLVAFYLIQKMGERFVVFR